MRHSGSAALRALPSGVPSTIVEGSASDGRNGALTQQVVVAARYIAPRTPILPDDIELEQRPSGHGFVTDLASAVGLEVRSGTPAGQALRPGDLERSAVIERNERVALVFRQGALSISTEGLALERAAIGGRVRVMNLSSRRTVVGIAKGQGQVEVSR